MEKAASRASQKRLIRPNYRFERKFVYNNISAEEVIQRVLLNSFAFKEIYDLRQINNIYFDDSNFNFYKQNVAGVAERKKVRLRWYGPETTNVRNPKIEIKKKFGEVGDKITFSTGNDHFDLTSIHSDKILELLVLKFNEDVGLHEMLGRLHPTLINTYQRRYFLSSCNRYRMTVDFGQEFFNPNYDIYQRSKVVIPDVILELKYNLKDDMDARNITQQIDTRLSKNSKYVRGIDLLYHTTY